MDFASMLEQETKKRQSTPPQKKDEKLRLMGGLNQYNRHAVQFCYHLSNETDYRV
ncbi:MAG: hypothetical protein MR304_02110 [Eubacterium sp.]|nr:hypothetical protein [Eubacterium sp.]